MLGKSSNFAAWNDIVMLKDVKHNATETPIATDVICSGNAQKKYYTADEAIAFLEPRIREMFQSL